DGKAQVDSYLKRLEGDSIIQAVLLDSQNREVAGSATVDGAQELAAKAISGNQAEVSVTGIATLAAHPAFDSRGNRYVLVLKLSGAPLPLRLRPRTFLWRVVVILSIAAIVCYRLARYLASPVVKLRAATQELAGGNLKARVGPAIGNRRDELADLARD